MFSIQSLGGRRNNYFIFKRFYFVNIINFYFILVTFFLKNNSAFCQDVTNIYL